MVNEGDRLYSVRTQQAVLGRAKDFPTKKKQHVIKEIICKIENEDGGIEWEVLIDNGPGIVSHSMLKELNLPLFLEWARKELALREEGVICPGSDGDSSGS
jgi:hypothetical protein